MKNRQKRICYANSLYLQIHSMFKLMGLHLSWWKSGKPSQAGWLCASWRSAPSLVCFFLIYILIGGEHATRVQSMARNQIQLYQMITGRERMVLSINMLMDKINGYQNYALLSIKGWGNIFLVPQIISFASRQLNRPLQLMHWVCIIISVFSLPEQHLVIEVVKTISLKYFCARRTV